jgi:hypothetical protein
MSKTVEQQAAALALKLLTLKNKEKELAELEREIKQLSQLEHQHQAADIRFDSGIVCLEGIFTAEGLREILAVMSLPSDVQPRFNK